MIYSTKDINEAFFGAIAKIAPEMDVTTFQAIANRGRDPEEVAKLDPEPLIIGAAWMYENLIDKQREALADKIITLADRIGVDQAIEKIKKLDPHDRGMSEADRSELVEMLEVMR